MRTVLASLLAAALLLGLIGLVAACRDDDDAAGDDGNDDTAADDEAADDDSGDDTAADDTGDDDSGDDAGGDDTGFVCDHDQGYVSETAKVHMIDVAGGEAIYVQTQWDYNILIGTAAADPAHTVVNYLLDKGVVRLQELVLASVLDEDLGGVADVLAAFPVDLARKTPAVSDTPLYAEAMKQIADRAIPVVTNAAGDTLPWLGEPELVLGPIVPFPAGYTLRDESLVIRFSIGRIDVLLTSAITATAERDILSTFQELVCSEALKVSYHGAGDATDTAFLDGVDPKTACIVAGWDNPQGWPAASTKAKLDERAILYGVTGNLGNMVWQSDGWDIWFCDG